MARLVEVVQALSLARDLATVMDIVRHAARELTGADGATFVLRDGDQCFYAEEDAISPLWKGQRFPMGACVSGWVMLHHRPAVIEDIYADPRIPADAYRPTFVRSLAMVPIRTLDPVGAIGNYWAKPFRPSPEQVRVLQALADTTAVAMENVQAYEQVRALATHLEEVREEEQKRLARELHDEMGGILAALSFQVSRMASRPPSETPDCPACKSAVAELVTAAIQTMRQTVSKLRPALLDEVGLLAAMESYLANFQSTTGIRCELRKSEDEPKLDSHRAAALFRILQESLTNVVKHAEAGRVGVSLRERKGALVLEVSDDGKGFDTRVHRADAFGLLGIRERAALVGAKAEISSVPGRGTKIRVSMPLGQPTP
jgi:signal transduction histidine kinase